MIRRELVPGLTPRGFALKSGTAYIHTGDVIEELQRLPDQRYQCCVTSPPYYGLRDYGTDNQIGLEPTPEAYIATMVEVFREVWRVLRDDGTLWLNLGDSYAANSVRGGLHQSTQHIVSNAKPKDLLGIPWRVAFALQDDGWYLRSDIIWHKPNPMPESVLDRPTSSHEHVFMLTKSPRYFFDQEAVKERGIIPGGTMAAKGSVERLSQAGVNARPPEYKEYDGYRNIRDVWTINTNPYKGAHFATMPPELAEKCILAGSSEKGCCSKCGAPWVRDIENPEIPIELRGTSVSDTYHRRHFVNGELRQWRAENPRRVVGWQSSCNCDAPISPCWVLDPFGGSGTTGMVAGLYARHSTLIELNSDYVEIARKRIWLEEVPVVVR